MTPLRDLWDGINHPWLYLKQILSLNEGPIRDSSSIDYITLWWRHNGCDSVSNHQPHDCLLNRLFRRRSKKTSKLRVTGLCVGNSPGTGEFPAQMTSNAENVSIWWRHHEHKHFIDMDCILSYNVDITFNRLVKNTEFSYARTTHVCVCMIIGQIVTCMVYIIIVKLSIVKWIKSFLPTMFCHFWNNCIIYIGSNMDATRHIQHGDSMFSISMVLTWIVMIFVAMSIVIYAKKQFLHKNFQTTKVSRIYVYIYIYICTMYSHPCLLLTAASDWLTTVKQRPLSWIWRHQRGVFHVWCHWYRHDGGDDHGSLAVTHR